MDQKKTDIPFPHDSSYRYLLSSKKLFMELLRSFVSQGWVKQVDESSIEEINHSFVLSDFRRKEADLVYKVRLNERDVIFYLLVELQSTVDMEMPYRLLLYQVEIWRYVLRNRETAASESSFSLPAIVPMVLYNGQRPWAAPRRFRQLLSGEEAFGSELLDFEYILLDVERYTEEELLALSNTIGSVFLLDQTADQELLLERLRRLMDTIRNLPDDLQGQFINWLTNMIKVQLPPESRDVEHLILEIKEKGVSVMGLQKNLEAIKLRGIEEGIEKGIEKGIEEGIEKGRALERENVARNMIALGLDNAAIEAATGVPEEKIEQMRKQLH
ncbi:Rpn family recombination-promoting nuclease/putative transposase [Paenibacillus hamazuiensis]|uniref:Rpn family recombination-promoting nuclease/putative transposase n=1 Tax=Paenibacillus hamazuiensis TaxID=2936508 RepID=UPI0023DF19C8|nr:Rpn family recombination-promoting nuclease/putative transposase [Paenibacillus hamazuiensis]